MFDLNKLLKPIRKNDPVGLDMRLEKPINPLYTKIKDARLAARKSERQHLQGGDARDAHVQWAEVLTLGKEILTKHSKDLEIAVWMTEALLREAGFGGLRDGFKLLHGLIERFWEVLYPTLDEEGISARVISLTGLNGEETEGTLIVPIAMIALTQGRTVGPFALWQWQQAQHGAQDTDTLEAIKVAVRETPPLFFHQLREELLSCKQAFLQLSALLDQRCSIDAPPSARIRTQLDACFDCIHRMANDITVTSIPTQDETQKAAELEISHREQILQNVLHAADFFRRTEPHSPLSYILERTVRWGRMSLPELLKELVRDEPSLGQIRSLTGIET